MILRHVTSKRQKPMVVDLKLAPMVMAVLKRCRMRRLPAGPLIVCEFTGRPFADYEFRRRWRICADAAGVPKQIYNMDARAGAISEAFAVKANPDFIRETAIRKRRRRSCSKLQMA
jgi:hypothetical protein